MEQSAMLSEAERRLIDAAGDLDLPPRLPDPFRIVHASSKCLLNTPSNPRFNANARPGLFEGPGANGERVVLPELVGTLAGGTRAFIERTAGEFGTFVREHADQPIEAVWRDASDSLDGKAGYTLPSGNKIGEILVTYWLLLNVENPPLPAVFVFAKSGLKAGRDLLDHARRLRLPKVNLKGHVLGKWRVWAELANGDPRRPPYLAPSWRLLGKYGEADGPTRAELMLTAQAGRALSGGELWPPDLEELTSLPAPRERGRITLLNSAPPPDLDQSEPASIDDDIPF